MKKSIFLFFFLLQSIKVYPSHVIGAEVSYQCIGSGQYQITFIYYYDCSSGGYPLSVQVYGSDTCLNMTGQLLLSNLPVTQIIPQCAQLTNCDGGIQKGIQKLIFSGIATMSSGCVNTRFVFSFSARTCDITTVQFPCANNFYLEATLYNADTICDNSPVFTKDPIIFACVNQPYCLDPGLFDPDGDSIVCSLINPMTDPNNTLQYDSGYSSSQILQSIPPVSIDSKTGVICFTPTKPEVTVYAILVSSYRNGNLISEVERDIILYAINCSNSQPVLSGINGSGTYDTSICVNIPTCFDIFSSDPIITDSTKIVLNHNINNATDTIIAGLNESAQFCWTPGLNDISAIPYCINAIVQDNSCPARQTNVKQYCITVVDSATCATLTSNNSILKQEPFKIFPQPAIESFIVDCGSDIINKNITFCIYNFVGVRVFQKKIVERFTQINDILPGIYIGNLSDEKSLVFSQVKFIVR